MSFGKSRGGSLAVATIVCAICGVLSSGCSFLFVKGPPDNVEKLPASAPITCTTNELAPVVDLLVTGFEVVRTIYAVKQSDRDYRNFPLSRNADIAFGAALSTTFGVSAIYGFNQTSACDDAKSAAKARRKRESVFSEPTPSPPPRVVPAPEETPAPEPPSDPAPSEDVPTE